jgi:hypothetical protein
MISWSFALLKVPCFTLDEHVPDLHFPHGRKSEQKLHLYSIFLVQFCFHCTEYALMHTENTYWYFEQRPLLSLTCLCLLFCLLIVVLAVM